MPADMTRYPKHWKQFSFYIRFTRAQGRCECTGQCEMHRHEITGTRCRERHGFNALFARGKVILTVAHLCHCNPPCAKLDHVIACCQRCHLRIDSRGKAARRRLRNALHVNAMNRYLGDFGECATLHQK